MIPLNKHNKTNKKTNMFCGYRQRFCLPCSVTKLCFYVFAVGCNCSSVGAINNVCNNMTGYCDCQPYVTGKLCDKCEQYAFNYTSSGCLPCNCDGDGSSDLQCDSVSKTFTQLMMRYPLFQQLGPGFYPQQISDPENYSPLINCS